MAPPTRRPAPGVHPGGPGTAYGTTAAVTPVEYAVPPASRQASNHTVVPAGMAGGTGRFQAAAPVEPAVAVPRARGVRTAEQAPASWGGQGPGLWIRHSFVSPWRAPAWREIHRAPGGRLPGAAALEGPQLGDRRRERRWRQIAAALTRPGGIAGVADAVEVAAAWGAPPPPRSPVPPPPQPPPHLQRGLELRRHPQPRNAAIV